MKALGVLASAALLLAGCSSPGEPLPPEWKGRDVEAAGWANRTVPAGWSFGLEYSFPAGQDVAWDWVAETAGYVTFTVFLVINGIPYKVGEQTNNEGKDEFTTPQAGAYQFVWDFDGLPETLLHYKLPEGGLARDYPPGSGPGCILLFC